MWLRFFMRSIAERLYIVYFPMKKSKFNFGAVEHCWSVLGLPRCTPKIHFLGWNCPWIRYQVQSRRLDCRLSRYSAWRRVQKFSRTLANRERASHSVLRASINNLCSPPAQANIIHLNDNNRHKNDIAIINDFSNFNLHLPHRDHPDILMAHSARLADPMRRDNRKPSRVWSRGAWKFRECRNQRLWSLWQRLLPLLATNRASSEQQPIPKITKRLVTDPMHCIKKK